MNKGNVSQKPTSHGDAAPEPVAITPQNITSFLPVKAGNLSSSAPPEEQKTAKVASHLSSEPPNPTTILNNSRSDGHRSPSPLVKAQQSQVLDPAPRVMAKGLGTITNVTDYSPEPEVNEALPSGVPRPSVLCGIVFGALAGSALMIWIGSRLILGSQSRRRRKREASLGIREWVPPKPNRRDCVEDSDVGIVRDERRGSKTWIRISEELNRPENSILKTVSSAWWDQKQWMMNRSENGMETQERLEDESLGYIASLAMGDEPERDWMRIGSHLGLHSGLDDLYTRRSSIISNGVDDKKRGKVFGWLGTISEDGGSVISE